LPLGRARIRRTVPVGRAQVPGLASCATEGSAAPTTRLRALGRARPRALSATPSPIAPSRRASREPGRPPRPRLRPALALRGAFGHAVPDCGSQPAFARERRRATASPIAACARAAIEPGGPRPYRLQGPARATEILVRHVVADCGRQSPSLKEMSATPSSVPADTRAARNLVATPVADRGRQLRCPEPGRPTLSLLCAGQIALWVPPERGEERSRADAGATRS
jgi:hypothetical protein